MSSVFAKVKQFTPYPSEGL